MQMKYMYAENNHTYKRKPIKLSQVYSSNIVDKDMLQNGMIIIFRNISSFCIHLLNPFQAYIIYNMGLR